MFQTFATCYSESGQNKYSIQYHCEVYHQKTNAFILTKFTLFVCVHVAGIDCHLVLVDIVISN